MTFRNFLENIVKDSGASKLYNLAEPEIVNTVRELQKKYSFEKPNLTITQLEDIYKEVIKAYIEGKMDTLSPYLIKTAAYCIWNESLMMCKNRAFFSYYLGLIETNIGVRRSLLAAYFNDYLPNHESTKLTEQKFMQVFSNDEKDRWSHLHRKKDLFNNPGSIDKLADSFLNSSDNFLDFWTDIGLGKQNFLLGNYVSETFDKVLDIYSKTPSLEYLKKIIDWSEPAEKELMYEHKRKLMIEKLCEPWISQDNANDDIKKTTLNFCNRNFGDLRNQAVRERFWGDINADSKSLIKKWLAGQTLEYFFNLISQSALDTHWDYRQKFWSCYYEDNLIEDAYVILGRQALEDLNNLKEEDRPTNFGIFTSSSSISYNHSVLLIQISNLTIVEWSHSGAMRFFLSDNEDCPILNKTENSYNSSELRNENCDDKIIHHHSSRGYWQEGAADIIEGYTSISMQRERYIL